MEMCFSCALRESFAYMEREFKKEFHIFTLKNLTDLRNFIQDVYNGEIIPDGDVARVELLKKIEFLDTLVEKKKRQIENKNPYIYLESVLHFVHIQIVS